MARAILTADAFNHVSSERGEGSASLSCPLGLFFRGAPLTVAKAWNTGSCATWTHGVFRNAFGKAWEGLGRLGESLILPPPFACSCCNNLVRYLGFPSSTLWPYKAARKLSRERAASPRSSPRRAHSLHTPSSEGTLCCALVVYLLVFDPGQSRVAPYRR
jgi:hypothetical protein